MRDHILNRALLLLISLIVIFIIYSCSDNSTNSNPRSEKSVISGKITATDGRGGIQDALLELNESDSVLQETYSDLNGEFSFADVEFGEYEVAMTLPQGYRESGTTNITVQVINDVSIEFKGEPVQSETVTVQAGKQDTVATASGAFVAVNTSDASSDIEITISEIESDNDTDNRNKPVKIHIRPPGSSKKSSSPAQRIANIASDNSTSSVSLQIGQRVMDNQQTSWQLDVTYGNSTIPFFANAGTKEITDQPTNSRINYFIHEINLPAISDIEFIARTIKVDNTCDNDYRELKEFSTEDEGKIPLIFIHGLQIDKGRCEDFSDFESLDLSDGDRENTFDYLVEKLQSNIALDFDYKFYSYTYPTNAPIHEASDELWHLINERDIKNPVLLAHSMGGVVARKVLVDIAKENTENDIRALITLGTPHEGTPIVKFLLNLTDPGGTVDFLENCPSDKAPVGCAFADISQFLQASIFPPDSPGLRDLRESESSSVIAELEKEEGNPDKIFTLGGYLGDYSAITDVGNILNSRSLKYQAVYEIGYFYLQKIKNESNDGLVSLKSALPDWSTKIATLQNHDHTEMVKGENYNEISPTSVYNKVAPLLARISGDDFFGDAPTINSISSTPNPSIPGETVNFSAEITGDAPIDCEWDFGDGSMSTNNCNTSYAYSQTGSFTVSLTVINDGGSDSSTLTQEVVKTEDSNVIYASSAEIDNFRTDPPSNLYAVEIAPEGKDNLIGVIRTNDGREIEVTDIAIEDNNIWAVSFKELYKVNVETAIAEEVGEIGFDAINALEIDDQGDLYAMNLDGYILKLDKENGEGEFLSSLPDDWISSGDFAFSEVGKFYGILRPDGNEDINVLAIIEPNTGEISIVNSETDIGFERVFGLTFVNNILYGLTTTLSPQAGYLIEIDLFTGAGSIIRSIDFQATGAAKENRF